MKSATKSSDFSRFWSSVGTMRKRPEPYEFVSRLPDRAYDEFVRVNGRWLIQLRDVAPKDER